jgi:hypothetical protein
VTFPADRPYTAFDSNARCRITRQMERRLQADGRAKGASIINAARFSQKFVQKSVRKFTYCAVQKQMVRRTKFN